MIYTMEQFLDMIDLECHQRRGEGFERDNLIPPRIVGEHYVQEGMLFLKYWKKDNRKSPFDDSDKRLNETIRFLDQLPAGISYYEHTEIIQPLPEKIETYASKYERRRITFIVVVSEEYSRRITSECLDNNVILSNAFSKSALTEANSFCQKIANEHPDILQPLFENGLNSGLSLSNKGFVDCDYGWRGCSLSSVGMKDLSSEVQRLGLAMALANYGSSSLNNTEFYYIMRDRNDTIIIKKED